MVAYVLGMRFGFGNLKVRGSNHSTGKPAFVIVVYKKPQHLEPSQHRTFTVAHNSTMLEWA